MQENLLEDLVKLCYYRISKNNNKEKIMEMTAAIYEKINNVLLPIADADKIDWYIEDLENSLWTNEEFEKLTADEIINDFNEYLANIAG